MVACPTLRSPPLHHFLSSRLIFAVLLLLFTILPFDTSIGLWRLPLRVGVTALMLIAFPLRNHRYPGASYALLLLVFPYIWAPCYQEAWGHEGWAACVFGGVGFVAGLLVFYCCCLVKEVEPYSMGLVGRPLASLLTVAATVNSALRDKGSQFSAFFNHRPWTAVALLFIMVFPIAISSVLSWAMFVLRASMVVLILVYMLPVHEED
ncbi:hypothetical protein C8R45DRAFT_1066806, partial [Mycena sanguinolenta]